MQLLKLSIVTVLILVISIFPITGIGHASKINKDQETLLYFNEYADKIYTMIGDTDLSLEIFHTALKGYLRLKEKKLITNDVLSIVDYSKSCNQKRFFAIDLRLKKVIYKSLIAHGRNSGGTYASNFSNKMSSMQSSLGFFITGEKFNGQHGYSLRLDGVERNINDKARERGIVIHAADYVSEEFVNKYGRLGRSQGCPALPNNLANSIIDLIKDKSCFFVYYPDRKYLRKSSFINQTAYSSRELAFLAAE